MKEKTEVRVSDLNYANERIDELEERVDSLGNFFAIVVAGIVTAVVVMGVLRD